MARTSARRSSFRDKVSRNSQQQRSKAANYGHLALPRGINVFKEEAGSRVSLDFLPYVVTDAAHPDRDDESETATVGALWYKRPYKLHRNIGSDNSSLVCPGSIGKKCPICEYRAKLLSDGADWKDDSVRALRASDRNLYYVVPKDAKKFEEKAHIWDIAQYLFQNKLNDELEENDEFCAFPDLENGLTLRVRFSEEKLGSNTYADTSRIDFDARDYAYTEEQVSKLPSLDEVLTIKSYAEVEAAFLEVDGDGEDEDEGDKRPSSAAAVTPTPRRTAPEEKKSEESPPEGGKSTVTPIRRNAPVASPSPPAPAEDPRRAARRAEREAAASNEKCPHGHRFGVDTDKKDECAECSVWSECMDEMEALAKKAAE